jgi:hypothetical protein
MKGFTHGERITRIFIASAIVFFFVVAISASGLAQTQPASRAGQPAAAEQPLAEQLRALQEKVARLEAALAQSHPGPGVSGAGGMGMGKMAMGSGSQGGSMQGMGMMGGGMGMMQGMPPAQTGQGASGTGMGGMSMGDMGMGSMKQGQAMGPMQGMMGMMGMMGRNPAMGSMAMPSALPGFAGVSHIYHIGATNFFLDHPQHITLTTEQQTLLNKAKEKALLAQAESQRKIEQAEQELWELTAADQPDAAGIDAKVREIEKLRGDQRLAFIRSVGEAAKALTPEQIKSLAGQAPPTGHSGGSAHQQKP